MNAPATSLTLPGPIAPGARIGLVAPSGPPTPASVDRAEALLRSWQLEPVRAPGLLAGHPRASYLAAPDAQRAADLQSLWCDESVDAVLCARGGYGAVRILDLLDRDTMQAATPKPFLGSSDITCLHEWFREKLGVATWFTPMPTTKSLLDDVRASEGLHRALFDAPHGQVITSPVAESLTTGVARGTVIGGNLSLLAMTLGARDRDPLDHEGCIALLEDVTESPYRIDSYLQSLVRGGWFDGVTGVALGSWDSCGAPGPIRELMAETLGPLGVPVVSELGFGHCPSAQSVPLGVPATLHADDRPRLVID